MTGDGGSARRNERQVALRVSGGEGGREGGRDGAVEVAVAVLPGDDGRVGEGPRRLADWARRVDAGRGRRACRDGGRNGDLRGQLSPLTVSTSRDPRGSRFRRSASVTAYGKVNPPCPAPAPILRAQRRYQDRKFDAANAVISAVQLSQNVDPVHQPAQVLAYRSPRVASCKGRRDAASGQRDGSRTERDVPVDIEMPTDVDRAGERTERRDAPGREPRVREGGGHVAIGVIPGVPEPVSR